MQKKKVKNLIKATAFILVFVLIISSLMGIFSAKWYDKNSETAIAEHFYELEDNSIDVLLLGSSQIAWSVDTVRFYEKYGIAAYEIGGSHNSLLMNYYWLLEALKTQKNIKTVMVDVSLLFNKDADEDADYLKNLQNMKWGKNKYNAIKDYYNKIKTPENEENTFKDVLINYFFTLNQYHTRWNELDEVDFTDKRFDTNNVMGYTPNAFFNRKLYPFETFVIDNDIEDESDSFKPVQAEYLEKIIAECKARGLQIVLIKTPKNSWSKTASEYTQKLADKEGIDFIECTSEKTYKEIGLDYWRDMRDGDHLNARGGVKLADYFCEYLLKTGKYDDARKRNVIPKKELEIYHKRMKECYLNTTLTPEEYLEELSKLDYTVVLQSSGDISQLWNDKLQALLEKNGFDIKIAEQQKMNYFTAVKDGKIIRNISTKERIEDSIRIIPAEKYKFISDMSNTETKHDKEKAIKYSENGLRITAFDKDTAEPISMATIYESEGALKIAIEHTT